MNLDRDIKLNTNVWIAPDKWKSGNGTKDNPYACSSIDKAWPMLGHSGVLHLHPGEYTLKGVSVPKLASTALIGSGPKECVIKAEPAPDPYPPAGGKLVMISDAAWATLFYAAGFTLDGSWDKQGAGIATGNFKTEAIVMRGLQVKYEDVRFTNFGSAAKAHGQAGLEAMFLAATTVSNGPPYGYSGAFSGRFDSEPVTFVEIAGCQGDTLHYRDGGYSTPIFVRTNMPNEGDRQPWGIRTTPAARVHHCRVHGPGGGAFGCAYSENVVFEDNHAENCQVFFNCDTGAVRNLTLRHNQAVNCHAGINVTTRHPRSASLDISNNVISLSEPFYNAVLGRDMPFYAVRVDADAVCRDNVLIGPDDPRLAFLDGNLTDATNTIIRLPRGVVAGTTPSIAELELLRADHAGLSRKVSELETRLKETVRAQELMARRHAIVCEAVKEAAEKCDL